MLTTEIKEKIKSMKSENSSTILKFPNTFNQINTTLTSTKGVQVCGSRHHIVYVDSYT